MTQATARIRELGGIVVITIIISIIFILIIIVMISKLGEEVEKVRTFYTKKVL